MLVRTENINNTNKYLIVDEYDFYHGYMTQDDFYECMLENYPSREIDGYEFWYVNKKLIKQYCRQ